MKCLIPGPNVKLFARSIHCLSKIGEELYFEALKDGLALRTVNSSRSAYACFIFSQLFLEDYHQGADQIDSSDPMELLKCKITMKSCLAIFKSLSTIEKIVEQCKIIFQPDKCRLVFILRCKHGITKTHNLTYQECESLQAVFVKELCPNSITAQSKVMQDTVANFPNSVEEITLSVTPEFVKITNFVDDEPDPTKVVHTVTTLVPEEFDYFQIGLDTKVTFCLKELRAILAFSEFVNQPLSLHFEHAGKPIVLSFDSDELYKGDFVMATLSESDQLTQLSQQNSQLSVSRSTAAACSQNRCLVSSSKAAPVAPASKISPNKLSNGNIPVKEVTTTTAERKQKNVKNNPDNNDNQVPTKNASRNTNGKSGAQNIQEQTIPEEEASIANSSFPTLHGNRISSLNADLDAADNFFSESFPYEKGLFCSRESNRASIKRNTTPLSTQEQIGLNNSILRNTSVSVEEEEDQNTHVDELNDVITSDNEEVLMSTPPSKKKKFRSAFFGASSEIKRTNNDTTTNQTIMLAADTDDEDD